MGLEDIEFDGEVPLGPVDVELEAELDVVGRGSWQAGGENQIEEAPLEVGAGDAEWPVEGDSAPQGARAGVPGTTGQKRVDRAEVEKLEIFAAVDDGTVISGSRP
jgi:sirohydrochlorin ferrochelatase